MAAAQEELSFTYFPENYRWSHGLLIGLNMAPWGGAEIGEVNRIGLRLKPCVGDDNAWFREWAREACTVEARGRERIELPLQLLPPGRHPGVSDLDMSQHRRLGDEQLGRLEGSCHILDLLRNGLPEVVERIWFLKEFLKGFQGSAGRR